VEYKNLEARILIGLYLLVVLAPLGIAWASGLQPRDWRDELGSALGLVAFAAILVEFVLSGRFKSVSRRIGMDLTIRAHQLLARTILMLLLLHPFLYVAPYGSPRPWDPTGRETLLVDGATLASGTLAWLIVFILVVTGIARTQMPYRYETWRLAHGLGAVAVAGLGAHHTLGAGRYSSSAIMSGYWTVLLVVATSALVWVYLLRPLGRMRRPYVIESVRQIADRTWELVVAPKGHAGLAFIAGQFAWLRVGATPFSVNENPFSIATAPAPHGKIGFVIKEVGDFTRSISRLYPGERAWLDGPYGNLIVQGEDIDHIVMVAGGVGVAPFLSILRALALAGDERPVSLVYGNRHQTQIVYPRELSNLAGARNVSVVHVLSEPPPNWSGKTGLIGPALLRDVLGTAPISRGLYLLCGPPGMITAAERALLELGVPSDRIRTERFDYD
jgi:predicted ferric reductase